MVNDLIYTDVALRSCGYMQAADHVVSVARPSEIPCKLHASVTRKCRSCGRATLIQGFGLFRFRR